MVLNLWYYVVDGANLDKMNRELEIHFTLGNLAFPVGVEVCNSTMFAESGPVGNRIFPKAQAYP